jgi:hypothetical protein
MLVERFFSATRELRRREPFQPYTVELRGGDRLVVPHPEALAIYDNLAQLHELDDTKRYFDASIVLQVYSIVVPPA